MSLFKFLFNCRLKFRRFLYQNRYLIERMYSTAWFLMFFNIILTLIIRNGFSEAMLVIISICFFLIDFIRSIRKKHIDIITSIASEKVNVSILLTLYTPSISRVYHITIPLTHSFCPYFSLCIKFQLRILL